MKIALLLLAFVVLFKLVRRHRRWHGHGHGRGFGGWHRRGWRAPLYWLARELDLDPAQKDELEGVFLRVRDKIDGLRLGRWSALDALAEAVTGDNFDGARLEALAAKHAEAHAAASREVLAASARVHDLLTPPQREKLRARLARFGVFAAQPATVNAAGPYR